MVIVTVANQKGGVGKTTTAVTLAHGLALKGHTTLLVDLDPQGQCSSHLGLAAGNGLFNLLVAGAPFRDVVRTTGRDELWLLPGDKQSLTAQTVMAIEGRGIDALALALGERIDGELVRYVVIDTAPSAGGLQTNALWAADLLLIPSAVDHLSLEGVHAILASLAKLERPGAPLVRVLPTFYDQVTKESKANLEALREAFGEALLPPIHRAVVLRECPPYGQTIFEHAPGSRAAEEYAALVWGVLDAS